MKEKGVFGLILVLLIAACLPSLAPMGQIVAPATHTAAPATHTLAPTVHMPAPTDQHTNGAPIAAASSAESNAYFPMTSLAETATFTPIPTPTPTPMPTATPSPATGSGIVADHSVLTQFEQIPKNAIDAAAAKATLFMHQSTGGIIDDNGLGCLAGLQGDLSFGYPQECVTYMQNRAASQWPWYDKSNLNWDLWPSPQANAIAKTDQFVDVVHSRAANYQIIGMKYCYVDGWNQSTNVEQSYYINKMLELEEQYPTKTFIWATSALWSDPGDACNSSFNSCKQISDFNQQVRAYARAHNKLLYDVADIESHDRNGNPCTVQGYEGMCADWYADDGGGHPNIAGAIRLAKGFWWLMARVSGWGGTSSSNP